MSLLDILIWIILLVFAVKGFLKGFVREFFFLAGLLGGVWVAFRYHAAVSAGIGSLIRLPSAVASAIAFLGVLLVFAAASVLLGHIVTSVCRFLFLGGINRLGGAAFGLLQGGLLLAVLLHGLSAAGTSFGIAERVRHSGTARTLAGMGELIANSAVAVAAFRRGG